MERTSRVALHSRRGRSNIRLHKYTHASPPLRLTLLQLRGIVSDVFLQSGRTREQLRSEHGGQASVARNRVPYRHVCRNTAQSCSGRGTESSVVSPCVNDMDPTVQYQYQIHTRGEEGGVGIDTCPSSAR